MRLIETIIGILLAPFTWVYDRLIKGRPSSPPEFWLFIKELQDRGFNAQLQMQDLHIEGLNSSAIVVLDSNASASKVVNLFKCDSVEAATTKLAELQSNPAMSHCKQRDCYLMSVTLLAPDDRLTEEISEAFETFELPPDRSWRPRRYI